MPRWLGIAVMVAALLASASYAHGQKQTERFIPLGRSPGLSGKVTHVGTVEAADAGARTIIVAWGDHRYTSRVTAQTSIWLDRSRLKLTTLDGTFADLQRGRRVEVMPAGPGPGAAAEWVKVEITAAGAPGR
jgi:hypothetical protein